jgi:hypothetical protein
MIEQIQVRIDRLNDVGQQAFNGTDYSFGFNTWRGATLTLLRRLLPQEIELIEQIQNIDLHRVNYNRTDASAYNLEACKNEAREILQILIDTLPQPNNEAPMDNNQDFWNLLHPRVIHLASTRFENGHYADAVSIILPKNRTTS